MEKVDIPEGKSGNWEIRKFSVSKTAADRFNMRACFSSSLRGQYMLPGDYTQLAHNRKIIMSDTFNEMSEHSGFVRMAKGHVLINGLGIGMVLKNVLLKPSVATVWVNEIEQDVIDLVGRYYPDVRVTIFKQDAFTFKPCDKTIKFDAIWHDIWPDKCSDNLLEMAKLHRRYSQWLAPGGFQDSWAKKEIKYYSRKRF